ncbi:MAG TPA: VCBS repeat-containing protein [Verrucomicrobiae bacterium]
MKYKTMAARVGNYVGWLALLFINSSSAFADSIAFSTNSYAAGTGPFSVRIADVNNDGKLDLITANLGTSFKGTTITILTNTGNGAFSFSTTINTTNVAVDVEVGDINGDGLADLLVCGGTTNYITVLTNNGHGSYAFSTPVITSSIAVSSTLTDLRGLGMLDMICSETPYPDQATTTNYLSIYTNNGSGLFGLNASYMAGLSGTQIAVADVNGDGKTDLINCNINANTLTVWTNNGSAHFSLQTNYIVGSNPRRVRAVDVNGDGKPDLIEANNNAAGTFLIFTNNGSGIFGLSQTISTSGSTPDVTAADINGDGYIDLIGINNNGGGIPMMMVYTNNRTGYFSLNQQISAPDGHYSVAAADLNNDGKPDFVTVNFGFLNSVLVGLNQSTIPTASQPPTLTISNQGNLTKVTWPASANGWSLLQSTSLTSSPWTPSGFLGYPILNDGTNLSLWLPGNQGTGFFRLLHP